MTARSRFSNYLTEQDGYQWWLAAFLLLPLPLAVALTALGLAPFFEGFGRHLGLVRFLEAGAHAQQVWVYGVLVILATPCAFIALRKATHMREITRGTAWMLLLGCAMAAAAFLLMLTLGFPQDVAMNPTRAMRRLLVARTNLFLGYGFYLCIVFSIVFFAYVVLMLALKFIHEPRRN